MEINKNRLKNIEYIKNKTGNASDITYKDILLNNKTITIIYINSICDSNMINDFILKAIDDNKNDISKDIYNYFKNYIPSNNMKEASNICDALTFLLNGFTIILFDEVKNIIAFENKAKLNSNIIRSENEKSLYGPSDSFCENYETNIGLIRRRIRSENLQFKECTVGSESNSKVSIFYMNKTCSEKLVNDIYNKIKKINIKYVGNTNYILDAISNTNRMIFPSSLKTERADLACQKLIEGRIVLMCENTNEVIILPCMFSDFLKNPDDYYEKNLNTIFNRIIRVFALLLALLTPAIYISLMAYNIEAIPSGLLINFSIQRDGVPFPTVLEILAMGLMFQILRESDLRFPGKGGSSISIVGALVLGQAAVEAGIVSPITIIIVGISSVASLAFSSIELINSLRWWQLILILLATLFGFIGVMFGFIILVALLVSNYSCNKPYFFPFEPFSKKGNKDAILIKNNYKFNPLKVFKREDNNEKDN